MATATHTSTELVRRAFDALNDRDREAFVELHQADAVLHLGEGTVDGIDAIADHEFAHFEAFPDLALTPAVIVAEGDVVAARWTVAGTHDGAFRGVEPTGESVEFAAMGTFRVEDGAIAEVWLVADELGMLAQLGLVEPPGE